MHLRTRILMVAVGCLLCLTLALRFYCGIFVIQPIGAVPEGATIVYWRHGLHMPFVASADGLVVHAGATLSLLTRGVMLGSLAKIITDREICRFGYSRALYLVSTGGREYER